MNLVEEIKALRSEIISKESMSQIVREASKRAQYVAIDDLCILALKYMICGNEQKAARCYIYALAAVKTVSCDSVS